MKKILIFMMIALLTIGAVTAVYASENTRSEEFNNSRSFGFNGPMMGRNTFGNDTYNDMIEIMEENGLEDAAQAMKNRDFNAMNDFMNDLTDEQYNQMIDIMRDNGYEGMANMMGSITRQEMLNMHNSMMGR